MASTLHSPEGVLTSRRADLDVIATQSAPCGSVTTPLASVAVASTPYVREDREDGCREVILAPTTRHTFVYIGEGTRLVEMHLDVLGQRPKLGNVPPEK